MGQGFAWTIDIDFLLLFRRGIFFCGLPTGNRLWNVENTWLLRITPIIATEGIVFLNARFGVICFKPVLIPHATYQDSVVERLRQHYSGGTFVVANDDWHLVAKLWMTDLSCITTLLLDCYDAKGPEPRDPASMLRSYLLFLMTKPEIGVTEWINEKTITCTVDIV